jgi:predicted O-linked N-acetylglucosamine transferase (SPINDLY family)
VFRDRLQGAMRESFRQEFARWGTTDGRVLLRHDIEGGECSPALYGWVDVRLDVFLPERACSGLQSFVVGVLVLALCGNRHAGRMVASVLTKVGLPDLIARSPEQYTATATLLVGDPDRLVDLRSHLRERMVGSPLCNGKTFTRRLEEAYPEMWRRWAQG